MSPDRETDPQAVGALFESRYGRLRRGGRLGDLGDLLFGFAHLPYENLTKILELQDPAAPPRPRRPAQVMADHLRLGTGGTCFSLTELLRLLGRLAGFPCYPVMAQMRHGPNIHCALRVEAEGQGYLVDPGYLVRQPLLLTSRAPRPGALPPGRAFLAPAGSLPGVPAGIGAGDFDLFTVEAAGPRWRYRFADRPVGEADFLGHWQRSFSQPAMRSLLVTRRTEEGELLYLHNHQLRQQQAGERRTRNVRAALERTVQECFGIDPRVTRAAAALLAERRQEWLARRGPGGRGAPSGVPAAG